MTGKGTTKSFAVTLGLLPAVIQIVIMLVNGNLGAGMAVMGAFSLVRFRSIPGSSKEICMIFFAMTVGLAVGMGYITFAALFTGVIAVVYFVMDKTKFGESSKTQRTLRVTIPETLNYIDAFDDIFEKYTGSCDLETVRTTNLGSMFELTYLITIKDLKQEKAMIDEIRCRNANLTIVCTKQIPTTEKL
jgi:uncharacterized membrane protein YhiD involved in acid resistance